MSDHCARLWRRAFCIDPTVPVAYPAFMGLLAPASYEAAKVSQSCAAVSAVLVDAIRAAIAAGECPA